MDWKLWLMLTVNCSMAALIGYVVGYVHALHVGIRRTRELVRNIFRSQEAMRRQAILEFAERNGNPFAAQMRDLFERTPLDQTFIIGQGAAQKPGDDTPGASPE